MSLTPEQQNIVQKCISEGKHRMEKTFMVIMANNGNFRIWSCNSCNLEESRKE